tara:strand:+ start:57 stop:410 length:354 start_codon:yes stop_codon:yes gene_type:complete
MVAGSASWSAYVYGLRTLILIETWYYVCMAKGGKNRTTLFPESIQEELRQQVERVRGVHEQDLAQGFGKVYLPESLARKYPNASSEFRWQYLFPSKNLSIDPRSKVKRRHHVLELGL